MSCLCRLLTVATTIPPAAAASLLSTYLISLVWMSTSLYPLASLAQIEKTPSREDGIPEELELDLRAYGCKLIHEAGILLKQ